jgi:predicted transcriptional regulator of viral defense system
MGDQDDRAASAAERQEGAISRDQLRESGLSGKQIGRRLRSGRLWSTAARGVYTLPGAPPSWRQDLWVAVLAGPDGTVVSHASAAALYGLRDAPTPSQVTVGRTASGRFGGAGVHHATVGWADRCRVNGLPVTRIARTIVDCAGVLDQEGLNGLVWRRIRVGRRRGA